MYLFTIAQLLTLGIFVSASLDSHERNSKSRALLDIKSSPEVRKFFKIRTVQKPDIFLPGCQTFKTLKRNQKKIQKII